MQRQDAAIRQRKARSLGVPVEVWNRTAAARRFGFLLGVLISIALFSGLIRHLREIGWAATFWPGGPWSKRDGNPETYVLFRMHDWPAAQLLAVRELVLIQNELEIRLPASGLLVIDEAVACESLPVELRLAAGSQSVGGPQAVLPDIIQVTHAGWPLRAATYTGLVQQFSFATPFPRMERTATYPWRLAANLLVAGVIGAFLASLPGVCDSMLRLSRGRCAVCGYPTRPSGSVRCPECGSSTRFWNIESPPK
jgi:hypothetical protein